MISQLKIILLFLFPLLFCFQPIGLSHLSEKEKLHHIIIKHPGEKEAIEVTLIEIQNKNGHTVRYKMDVKSVICLEEVCKVIPVTLFWNAVGEYQAYKLQEGATLEKYEDDLFESVDYEKLDLILKTSNSPFKDVFIEEILTVSTDIEGDIDAFSGETILELNDDETVHGAALTCYTLWHWANGEITSVIKTKTGQSASNEQLNAFIRNGDPIEYKLAIDELYRRELFTKTTVNSVVQAVMTHPGLVSVGIEYFEHCPLELYLNASQLLFEKGNTKHRISILQSLNSVEYSIPKTYLDNLSTMINNLESYQEVSLLLDLMENKNSGSETVITNATPLLHGDFFVARRVYWFLKNQNVVIEDEDRFK